MSSYNNFNSSQHVTGYPNMDSIFNPGNLSNNIPQLNKNYIMVTSLQEALGKESPYNSKGVYIHQDGEYEFEIFTDANGRKTYEIFKRVKCTNEKDIITVSRTDYEELKARLIKLEEYVHGKSADDITNSVTKVQ